MTWITAGLLILFVMYSGWFLFAGAEPLKGRLTKIFLTFAFILSLILVYASNESWYSFLVVGLLVITTIVLDRKQLI